jgi:hypothetical protein
MYKRTKYAENYMKQTLKQNINILNTFRIFYCWISNFTIIFWKR